MKFDLSCKDVTHLLLDAEDRTLSLRERLAVRFHLAICTLCPPFERQLRFMRSAMGRWKAYAEHEPPEA